MYLPKVNAFSFLKLDDIKIDSICPFLHTFKCNSGGTSVCAEASDLIHFASLKQL